MISCLHSRINIDRVNIVVYYVSAAAADVFILCVAAMVDEYKTKSLFVSVYAAPVNGSANFKGKVLLDKWVQTP